MRASDVDVLSEAVVAYLGDAGRLVAAEMKRRHPGLSDLAADAMGWNSTFQWR